MPIKHLLENLKTGGEFEYQLAKMLIVFIYQLWEDNFRHKIAASLSISKNQVESDLMGDIRHMRNSIIHKSSDVRQENLNALKMLSQIWDLKPGKLLMSKNTIHSLMEQINALRVTIKHARGPAKSPNRTGAALKRKRVSGLAKGFGFYRLTA